MFDGIAEHEVAECEVAERDFFFFFFFTKLLIFLFVSFYFFLFKRFDK